MKTLWLKGLFLALVLLGASLAVPGGRVIWARAIIAVGPRDAKFWAFRQVEALGPTAIPAVTDLILSDDFWPVSADGQLEATENERAVHDWLQAQGTQVQAMDRALIALYANKARQLLGEKELSFKNIAAVRSLLRNRDLLYLVPARPAVLQDALASKDRFRRHAALLYLLCALEKADRERGLTQDQAVRARVPGVDLSGRLAEIARSDSSALNAGLAAVELKVQALLAPETGSVSRFLEALSAACAGPLRNEPFGFIQELVFKVRTDSEPKDLRRILKTALLKGPRRIRPFAAFTLAGLRPERAAPEAGPVVLRHLGSGSPPILRGLGLLSLNNAKVSFQRALPHLLSALDPHALRGFRDRDDDERDLIDPVCERARRVLLRYSESEGEAVARLIHEGSNADRLKLILASGQSESDPVKGAIRRALNDEDPEVQSAARFALGQR